MTPCHFITMTTSLASVGLKVFGDLTKGKAEKAGWDFRAQTAVNSAELGRMSALRTSTFMNHEIERSQANIAAIQASHQVSPDSPTSHVLEQYSEHILETEKAQRVANIGLQSAADTAAALYYQRAGRSALLGGELAAAGDVLGAISGMKFVGGGGGGSSDFAMGFSPGGV